MEVKVTVVHELGEATKTFIAGLLGGQVAAPAKAAKTTAASKENTDEEAEEEKPATRTRRSAATTSSKATKQEEAEEEDEAPKGRTRRSTAAKEEEKPRTRTRGGSKAKDEDEATKFEDMSEEDQLNEIKAKVTLTTKKKGGADDVRELLGVFDAGRASELDPKDYVEFYDVLSRYRAGESVDEIFPQVD